VITLGMTSLRHNCGARVPEWLAVWLRQWLASGHASQVLQMEEEIIPIPIFPEGGNYTTV
jgi:hypothetical protein